MILVVGATGTVGGYLVPRLHASGQRVRALVRNPEKARHLPSDVECVRGDLDEPDTLPAALNGVHSAYLISAAHHVPSFLTAAKEAGMTYVVRQSTLEAADEPPFGPGVWHREAERAIEESGLAWAHVRPTMMMSNTIGWWAESIRSRAAVFFPGGNGQISPVHPDDIAAIAAVLLTDAHRAGHAYEVTGPQLLTIGDMVATLAQVLDRPIRYVDVPEETAREWMATSGMAPQLANALVETMTALRANRFARICETVQRLTGRPGQTFAAWCGENTNVFQPSPSSEHVS